MIYKVHSSRSENTGVPGSQGSYIYIEFAHKVEVGVEICPRGFPKYKLKVVDVKLEWNGYYSHTLVLLTDDPNEWLPDFYIEKDVLWETIPVPESKAVKWWKAFEDFWPEGRPELPIVSYEAAKLLCDPEKAKILHRAMDNYQDHGDGSFKRAEKELAEEKMNPKRDQYWISILDYKQANDEGFTLNTKIAFKIIKFRESNSLTNIELSKMLGISLVGLESILHGHRPMGEQEAEYITSKLCKSE